MANRAMNWSASCSVGCTMPTWCSFNAGISAAVSQIGLKLNCKPRGELGGPGVRIVRRVLARRPIADEKRRLQDRTDIFIFRAIEWLLGAFVVRQIEQHEL